LPNRPDDRCPAETADRSKEIPSFGRISPTCPHCGKLVFPWLVEQQPKRRALRAVLVLFLVICGADFLWDVIEMIRGVSRF
jgi:hypothetical protein